MEVGEAKTAQKFVTLAALPYVLLDLRGAALDFCAGFDLILLAQT